MKTTAYDVAKKLAAMDKGDHIADFGPKILELMRGVPWAVFIELDEKPGRFGYMNDRFYMLRQVRNNQEWGRQMFDGLTERGKGVTPKRKEEIMITVVYESVDGVRKRKKFKRLENARKYAHEWVGEHPTLGSYYAVSDDGVGKITANINLRELFPDIEVEVDPEDPEPQPPEWSGFDSQEMDDN